MKNAGRLLEVQTIGSVETLAVAGYNRADNESLASSTSSGAMVPGGFGIESRTGSPRQPQRTGLAEDGLSEGLLHKTPPMTGDETELMGCRMRRLEGGRRRAERARRVASSRRVARVAEEQRKMLLTGDPEALALSKSSFQALLLITQGTAQAPPKDGSPPAVAGLEKAHILALRGKVVLELSEGGSNGPPQRRKGSVEVVVETVRRGSAQLRRESAKLVAEVKERALKHPISPTGNSDRNDDGTDDKKRDDGNKQEAKLKEDGTRGEKEDALGANAGGAGVTERTHLTPDSPGNAAEKGTSPEQQQPQQQQKRQRAATRSPRNKGQKAGEGCSVTLEELLAAVDGLSHKVEQEGRPMGAAAYAAWWLGAVSAPQLELKKRFLTPG